MENRFMKFVNNNKGFVIFYLVWFFINFILLLNYDSLNDRGFWPFGSSDSNSYGLLELFVYLGLPLLIFAIVKLIGEDNNDTIDQNNEE